MNARQHPVSKTATDLRRSINRLYMFKAQFPNDEYVSNGAVDELISNLKAARLLIPVEVRDDDLAAGGATDESVVSK